MKIGIFTLPFHSNYGGILQAWALQEVLRKMGHEPIVFRQPGFQAAWALQPLAIVRRTLMRFHGSAVPLLARFHASRLESGIARFCRERISQSKLLSNDSERASFVRSEGLEAVIAGSDQIWRPGATGLQYFLTFLDGIPNVRRIAYAASFGCDRPAFGIAEKERYSRALGKFNALSVREADAVSLCREMAGKPVEHVVDPTLLLSTSDYSAIAMPKRGGGPVCYFLAGTHRFDSLLNEVSREIGMPFAVLPTASDEVDKLFPSPMSSVEEWIGTIASASCVLTDSFHGTVFAILFRKPFVSLDNGSGFGRIASLLRLLGMEERLCAGAPSADCVARLLRQPLPEEAFSRKADAASHSRTFLRQALDSHGGNP